MIRVLQLAHVINRQDFIDNIVRHADRSMFEIDVCTRARVANIAEPIYDTTVRHHRILDEQHGRLATMAQLARLLRVGHYDVLHAHHFDQALLGAITVGLSPRTKLVIGRHYSDSMYALPPLKRHAYLALEALINRRADAIAVPSTMIRDLLVQRQGVDPEKVVHVPYAFDPAKYHPVPLERVAAIRAELSIEGRLAIGAFGRLFSAKGLEVLLRAFAHVHRAHTEVRLVLVGDGPQRAELEALAIALDVKDAVRFAGWRTDAMSVMSAVDVVAHASYTEAFSQVMVEALLLEKPLVITDVSGVRDLLQDRISARIVPVRDQAALTAALDEIVSDAVVRSAMAVRGAAVARAHLLAPEAVRPMELLYRHVVASKAS
ncbi:MAG: glycosyltransferase [Gaiellales bacterium]